ncbi:PREDICTED: uncharacterized protein LOC109208129 [Nicotiana attenuata]|uniref:uncharacterized protein LOC109208129 n=1 Tax=Nicotiana attenuata TaxID=49451 RepID=UPI000904A8B8|nr:PREDICTED: uncharacterized protein LOC109208129 [Nicotiana attenuata]
MAMSQPNLTENPVKLSKFRNINQAQQRNRLSFWVFIFSIFMYISIFYIFNLSPSTLLNTTNFWFFISNTLILIIAVDFGSFSSSSNQQYSFEEYIKKCQQEKNVNISTSSFNYSQDTIKSIEYKEIMPQEEVVMIKEVEEQQEQGDDEEENIKDVVFVEKNKKEKEIINITNKDEVDQEDKKKNKKSGEAKCERSNSEKAMIKVATNNGNIEKKINGIQRSKSERYNFVNKGDEENEEFSEMSVEELNRRVEEFILRFNRQIRLQAVARNLQT